MPTQVRTLSSAALFSKEKPALKRVLKNLIYFFYLFTLMDTLFLSFAIAIIIATVLGILLKVLKQPPLVGYILAGILLGTFLFPQLNVNANITSLNLFSQIGISLLLFIIGLNLNPSILRKLGFISLITGLSQIVLTSLIGFIILKLLNFSNTTSFYLGVALAFSSTVIVIKLLSDKNDLDSLYGKVTIGILLIQDVVALFILMFLLDLNKSFTISSVSLIIIKGLFLILILFLVSRFVLSKLFDFISNSPDLLFVSGITWCFLSSILSVYLGFSLEIGAFLAGITLSFLPYNSEVISKISPLRDFFLILFFILIGLNIKLNDISSLLLPAVLLSLFVLLIKPLVVLVLMGTFKYTKRTSFLTGINLAQVSEFSIIMISLGVSLGTLNQQALTLITLVSLITILFSTYKIMNNQKLYDLLSPYLSIFERKKIEESLTKQKRKTYDIVILGAHRTSYYIIKKLKSLNKNFIVVDFDPEQTEKLNLDNIDVLFGDISDSETIEKIKTFSPKIVISTIKDYEDNLLFLNIFKKHNKNITFISSCRNFKDFISLYQNGADLVILPETIAGHTIAEHINDLKKIKELGKKYYDSLIKDKDKFILN